MPHGSYKRRTDEERKYYVNRYNRLYKTRTVNIGSMIDHWKVIKEENCCLHDPDVAKLLIECYYDSRGKVVDLNHPPASSLNGPSAAVENGTTDSSNALKSNYQQYAEDLEEKKTIEVERNTNNAENIEQMAKSGENSRENFADEAPVLANQNESKTNDSSALHTVMKSESESEITVKIEKNAPNDKSREKDDAESEQSHTEMKSDTEDNNEPLDLSEKSDTKPAAHDEDENTMDLDLPSLTMKISTKTTSNAKSKEKDKKPKTVSKPKKSKAKAIKRSQTTKPKKESTPKSSNNVKKKVAKENEEEAVVPDPPRNPWQHIRLEDHTDKYSMEKVESFERRNRGAEVYEIMYVCQLCNQFKSVGKEVFEEHLECHINKVLDCSVCGYVGFANSDMIRHRQVCCRVKKGREYVCHLCGATLISRGEKVDHMGNVHGIPELPCRWCKELFTNRHLRKKHYRTAHKDLCQYCDSCKQGLSKLSKIEFKRHVETCVPGHQCQYCGKLFSRKQGLDSHVTFTHLKVRKHTCSMCPYTATTPEKLKLHVLAHQGVRPYKCDQCTFTCVQPYQLKSHMRTHTGEKPFKCDQCYYAAAWNVQLKDHKKAHLCETAVLCHACNVVFKNLNVLSMHQKKAQCRSVSAGNQVSTSSSPSYTQSTNVTIPVSLGHMTPEPVLSPSHGIHTVRSMSPEPFMSHSQGIPAGRGMMSPAPVESQYNGIPMVRGAMSPDPVPSHPSGIPAVDTVISSRMIGLPEHGVRVDSPHISLQNPAQLYHDQVALHYHHHHQQQQQEQQQQQHMLYDHQQ